VEKQAALFTIQFCYEKKKKCLKIPLNKATENPSESSELSHIPGLRKAKISHPPRPNKIITDVIWISM
jgi:hypothetical protein